MSKRKNKKKHGVLKIILIIVLIIAAFVTGFVGYSVYKNGWGVKGLIQTAMGTDNTVLEDLDPFTVLILGVSKDIEADLTDTIMIASYNPKTQKATLISIPRDTFVGNNKNTATSYNKINALYQTSPQKVLAAVNKITGLNITYYVVINNNILVQLVDELGGIEYDVPINMDYDDSSQDLHIHLKAGPQKLTGEQSEWLVRFRHNNNGSTYSAAYGDNDLGRMRTQREFIKEVVKQTAKFKNVTKMKALVDILKENVTTNITNWSLLKDYIPYLVEFNAEDIQTATLPGTTDIYNKLWFFVHDAKKTEKLISEYFTEQNGEENESNNTNTTGNTINQNSAGNTNTANNSSNKNSTSNTNSGNQNSLNNTTNSSSNKNSTSNANSGNQNSLSNTTNSSSNKNSTSNTNSSNQNSLSNTTTNNNVSNVKIELLNGSGDSTLLTKATKDLKNAGFNVYKTGTTTATAKTTIINKTAVQTSTVEKIKGILKVGNISNSVSSSSTVDVTIVLGKDYK